MNRVRAVIVPTLIFGFLLLVTRALHYNFPWTCAVFAVTAVPILATAWAVTAGPGGSRHATVAHVHRDVADVAG